MRLLRAVLYWDEPRLEVVAEDKDGHRRLITVNYQAKEAAMIPQRTWVKGVEGEIEFQRTEEQQKASGRYIPR